MPLVSQSTLNTARAATLRSLTDSLTNSRLTTTVSAASWSGGTATITSAGHFLTVGATVQVAGITPSGYNGTFTVTGTTSNTVSYALVSNPGAGSAFGTVAPVTPCRVAADTRLLHFEGLGRLIETRQMRVVQPYGTSVKVGDILTVPNRGVFSALTEFFPTTNATSATVMAFQQRMADGSLNLATNCQVTVASKTAVPMLVESMGMDPNIKAMGLMRPWIMAWDPLAQVNNRPIRSTDRVDWTVNGIAYSANLRSIERNLGPAIHCMSLVDAEVSG